MSDHDDVEEFAALLRRLKSRTDHSYAALARRLNMNASTLHRYCAGDAVPLGFAPVERFAAMCKATPAERIELHRRWVLAVAARQRSRTATGSVPGVAVARSAGSEGPVTDGAAELEAEVAADPVSTTAADSVSTTATAATNSVSATAATAAGSVPEAAPGPLPGPRETSTESLPDSAREHDAASRPAPRTPWYRHRVTVTAALMTALIATLGGLSALSSGHSSATSDDQASGTTNAGARHGSPPLSAPASTKRGRPSGTPSPKAPDADDHSSSPSMDVSKSPSKSPSAKADAAVPPLTWTVNSQLWASGCNHNYIIDKAPQQVPPPPAPQDATPWARTQGAVHGGQTLVDVSVQGRTDTAVVLDALRVRVVGRAAPVKGTVYFTGQGCGADIDPRSFAVDLDMDRPIARSVQGVEDGTNSAAIRMPYQVSSKDPEVLMIDARTVDCDCRWYLELDWSSQGRTGTERIDDHGSPFRTSGTKGLPHYWYARGGWTPLAD